MPSVPRIALFGLLLAVCVSETSAQVAKLYPVDEAAQDSSFMLFRLRFIEALVERDTAFVYAHLSPKLMVSFGDSNGPDMFKMLWEPSDPNSGFWPIMAGVIGGGGTYDPSPDYSDATATFTAPYYFAAFPRIRWVRVRRGGGRARPGPQCPDHDR